MKRAEEWGVLLWNRMCKADLLFVSPARIQNGLQGERREGGRERPRQRERDRDRGREREREGDRERGREGDREGRRRRRRGRGRGREGKGRREWDGENGRLGDWEKEIKLRDRDSERPGERNINRNRT